MLIWFLMLLTFQKVILGKKLVVSMPYNRNRTNFCAAMKKYTKGIVNIGNYSHFVTSLRGHNVTVAYTLDSPSIYMKKDKTTNLPIGGFIYDLQQEVAKIGNFRFEYVLVPNMSSFNSNMEAFEAVLPFVDYFGNEVYSDTINKRSKRFEFSSNILDQSLQLITMESSTKSSIDYNAFLKPFTYSMWSTILGVLIINAIVNWFLSEKQINSEKNDTESLLQKDIEEGEAESEKEAEVLPLPFTTEGFQYHLSNIFEHKFQSFASFSGNGDMETDNWSQKFLLVFFGFFLLVIIASYTANLTTGMVMSSSTNIVITR